MFLQQLFEAIDKRHAAFAFGRMNPPTLGHGQLIDTVANAAAGGDYFVFVSQTQDSKKNPLDYATKIKFIKAMFPAHAGHVVQDTQLKTIMQIAHWLYAKGYRAVTFVAGSDRIEGFTDLLNKYNGHGQEGDAGYYKFDTINVVSSGDRDPDAEGLAGISATAAREAAKAGNLEAFAQATGAGELAEPLYTTVRKGMLLEGTFTNSEVRYMPGSGRGEWASSYTWKHDDKYGWHVRDPKGNVVYKAKSKEAVQAKAEELNNSLTEQDEIQSSSKLGQFIWDLYSWFSKAMPDANVEIKQAGGRVWTRGDGTRHRDPARIMFKDVASRDQGFEKLSQALKGARRTTVSGEFGSDPQQDAVIWKDKVFHKYGDFSIAVGSKSRVTNPNSVWREKPVAESEMTAGELRDMYNYYINVRGMSPEAAERLVYTRDEPISEGASGYIPKNKKEAKDPRWSNALTVDVHPDTPRKNMKALGLI